MKKGQGAKNRASYLEAKYGVEGVVAFFLSMLNWRSLAASVVDSLSRLPSKTKANRQGLAEWKKKLLRLNDEIAHFVLHAPVEHPQFFEGLDKVRKWPVGRSAYPDETAVINAYVRLAYTIPLEANYAVLELPAKVGYGACQQESGVYDISAFSRIVKRYGLRLVKDKPGRKSYIIRRSSKR